MTYHDLRLKLREIIAPEITIAPQWAKVGELSLSLKGQLRQEHELDEIPEAVFTASTTSTSASATLPTPAGNAKICSLPERWR
ncbi:hypothetical protein [Mesorhizobium amorphae]